MNKLQEISSSPVIIGNPNIEEVQVESQEYSVKLSETIEDKEEKEEKED